jgi:hypothetical protein
MNLSYGAPPVTPADYGHDKLFSFFNVTDEEVFDVIRGIKSETVGLDPSADITLDLVVLTCLIFPKTWKISKIPNPGELRDYRPISVLLALSKALEVVMRD